MTSEQSEADFLAAALAFQLVTVDDVIAWADRKILADSYQNDLVLDLSLSASRGKQEVFSLLKKIGNGDAFTYTFPMMYALLFQKFNTSNLSALYNLLQEVMYEHYLDSHDEAYSSISSMRIKIDMIEEGYLSQNDSVRFIRGVETHLPQAIEMMEKVKGQRL